MRTRDAWKISVTIRRVATARTRWLPYFESASAVCAYGRARIQVKNKLWTSMVSPEKLQRQRSALSRYHAVCFQSAAVHV